MELLSNNLDKLIMDKMKEKDALFLNVLRLIKSEFLKFEKSSSFKSWTEQDELKILLKMIAQRKDSIQQYKSANRMDLAENEEKELSILEKFVPEEVSDDEIISFTQTIIDRMKSEGTEISMKLMRNVLSEVQSKFPTANGKIVNEVIRKNM